MTKKEIEALAEAIAESVFQKLCKKQEEWDKQFLQDMADQGMEIEIQVPKAKQIETPEDKLKKLEQDLDDALNAEDYLKATELRNKIKKLLDKDYE